MQNVRPIREFLLPPELRAPRDLECRKVQFYSGLAVYIALLPSPPAAPGAAQPGDGLLI